MPSIAQEFQDPICSKKRRREEGVEMQMKIYSPSSRLNMTQNKETQFSPRRLINLKTTKRQRVEQLHPLLPPTHSLHTPPYYEFPLTTHNHQNGSYFPPEDRTRGWISDSKLIGNGNGNGHASGNGTKDLSPCHICHRRPTVVQELDAFANCEGCGERCCWICVRGCAGAYASFASRGLDFGGEIVTDDGENRDWSLATPDDEVEDRWGTRTAAQIQNDAHRRMICSRCCVEQGPEGEVRCLGCLRSEGGG